MVTTPFYHKILQSSTKYFILQIDLHFCRTLAIYILLKQNLYFFTNPLKSSLSAISSVLEYGGPDGEAGAAMRYLSQRYSMTDRRVMGALTDIGTEELGHLEIVATIIRQLTKILHRKKSRHPALINTILTTHLPYGRRQQVESLSVRASFRALVIQ